jgi:hypothetical protein
MRIYSSPVVVMDETKPQSRGWHLHAEEGTFSHVRSSPQDAHFFHTKVFLMPSRPIRLLPLLMLQDFCAVLAARWELRKSTRRSVAGNTSG